MIIIAAIAVIVVAFGWYITSQRKPKREGFQMTTAVERPTVDISGIVQTLVTNGIDKERMCPMIVSQYNMLNQQREIYKQKGNTKKTNQLTDMLVNIKNAHDAMKCSDDDTMSSSVDKGSSTPTQ